MRAESKSVTFLKDVQTFEIPFFQRAYVWTKENWEDLFNDLIRVNQRHFLGSIIVKRIKNSSGVLDSVTRVSVIDGQQRLTTLSILIKAIYDSFDEETKKNVHGDVIETLFYKKKKTDSAYHIKLKHSKVDKSDFDKVVGSVTDEGVSVIDSAELEKIDCDDENSKHKIFGCYKYFRNRLAECKSEIVLDLYNSILNDENKMLVVIELDDYDHEQQIFDTINSAGVRLTSTDIVKNALFQKALEFEDEDEVYSFYKATWDDVFSDEEDALAYWSKKKSVGRMMRDNSEILLQSVAIIEKIFDPSEHTLTDIPDLYKEYIKKMNKAQVKAFINTIIEYARIYQDKFPDLDKTTQYSFDDGAKRLFHILETLGLATFTPYILYLFKRYDGDDKGLSQRLGELEKFIMRRLIANESPKNYNKNCIEFIQDETRAGRMAAEITSEKVFAGLTKVNNREAALILFWIELNRRYSSQKFDESSLIYNYTLEHIMPQSWEKYWSNVPYVNPKGEEFSDENEGKRFRSQMIYSIGNMTLLSGKLNTSIKNNTFKIKMEGTSKRKGVKAYASLNITSKDVIGDVYNLGKEWNEKEICKRQVNLYKEFENIWGYDDKDPNLEIVPPQKGKKSSSKIQIFDKKGKLLYNDDKVALTMARALQEIGKKVGFKELADFTKREVNCGYEPLVRHGPHTGANSSSHLIAEGYYFNSHSDTDKKVRQLKKIATEFGFDWRIEAVKVKKD